MSKGMSKSSRNRVRNLVCNLVPNFMPKLVRIGAGESGVATLLCVQVLGKGPFNMAVHHGIATAAACLKGLKNSLSIGA